MSLKPTDLFNLLADETRLRSLLLMQAEGELCVCELTHSLEMSQPKVSRHLAALRQHKVVRTRRESNWIYYRISSDLPEWAGATLQAAERASAGAEPYAGDRSRLATAPSRAEFLDSA
ncbi:MULTISPECIES: metalloregulator ArsR/SmtB family transcription factor [unclassified Thioalkalivibrio]|uniref:metalloregulator ArsR/SmtB family transcription factor n=1 Tax=unclassified Thioalkalivibrio TaxID=2621013 RepID=UPI000372C692|nr:MULTISPECIES: metalloregulator ArsR/SmtB family transcription factor [unclassified Thioalkalivibrio]